MHYYGYLDRQVHVAVCLCYLSWSPSTLETTVHKLRRRNVWSHMHLWNGEWNQRLSCLPKLLETQNWQFVNDWLRSVKGRTKISLWWLFIKNWPSTTRKLWDTASGIQWNCNLFDWECWWNFRHSNWEKEAI